MDEAARRPPQDQTSPGLPSDRHAEVYDLAIIGGGPAGAHAALKAALLYKTAIVLDKGLEHSRVSSAPRVDNLPGQPEGVPGPDLIRQGHSMIEQTEEKLGRRFVRFCSRTEVIAARREASNEAKHPLYVLTWRSADPADDPTDESRAATEVRARNLVVATGTVDQQPIVRSYRERDAGTIIPYANKGLTDYCLLCEGHMVEGKRVAVLGRDRHAGTVAASLQKNFRAHPVVVTCGGLDPERPDRHFRLPQEVQRFLQERNIPVIEKEVAGLFGWDEACLGLRFEDGTTERFDRGWISMGWASVNSELAVGLGAATDDEGMVQTTRNCEAVDENGEAIPGLFAVGDVRADSWNQVPIAWGEAETAVIHAFSTRL